MTDADHPETYEQRVQAVQLANQAILDGFETWLRQSGLSESTIKDHADNMRFFSRYLLLYAYSMCRLDEATEGAVYDFLEDWFPRKALWASVSSMKIYLASFKKFFKWMGETGLVAPATVEDVLSTLKDDRNLFLSKVAEEFSNGEARKWLDEKLVPPREREIRLTPLHEQCVNCGERLWVAYHAQRTLMTFRGLVRLTLVVRRCRNAECELYHLPYRAEEEGAWALPHGEFGLDIITVIGQLRYGEHRSIPEIHQRLIQRGVSIAQRTVTDLLERYEELVALQLADEHRLLERLKHQGQVILAIDGMQPDVGHEVLWVIRDCLSGEVLLARSLLSSTQRDLFTLLSEVKEALPVPIVGVISDGQQTIRKAIIRCLPGVPHQLCQFHYVREAAKPIFEADRHAKAQLKQQVRGVRPIERALEGQEDSESQAMHGYCLAVRSALTDDGRPPLAASGLKLHERLTQISDSLARVEEKRGAFLLP